MALLKTLLNQAGPPLIIDQAEEDLDNPVMLHIVDQVWQAKQKRQLIFASHNANLVVNGDAELVVWCDHRAAKLEPVEKIRFGFEVGKERPVGNASFFGYARCRRTQPLFNDDARRRQQNCVPLFVALWSGHVAKISISVQTVNYYGLPQRRFPPLRPGQPREWTGRRS